MFSFSVVHLARSKDRKNNIQHMKKQLSDHLHIHKAIDAKTLSKKQVKLWKDSGYLKDTTYDVIMNRGLTMENIAISMSHVKLWEWLLENRSQGYDYHVIFEDDVQIQYNFQYLLKEKYLQRWKQMDFAHLYVFPQQAQEFNLKRRGVYRVHPGFWGAQCYLIPHSRLKWLINTIKPLSTTIDEQLTRLPMKSYFVHDDFVTHGNIKSENKYKFLNVMSV